MERDIRVRYRIDGNLREIIQYDNTSFFQPVSRLCQEWIFLRRENHRMDVSRNVDGREYDIRYLIFLQYMAKCVMRIASRKICIDKSKLGLTPADLRYLMIY
ncbi:MAG: hypothetical protein ACLT33_09625 [Lachnospira pectinoschiza]